MSLKQPWQNANFFIYALLQIGTCTLLMVFIEPNNPWFCGAEYLQSLAACLIRSLNPRISLQHLQPRHDSYFLPTGSVLSLHKHPETSEEQAAQLWMAVVEQNLFLQSYGSLTVPAK